MSDLDNTVEPEFDGRTELTKLDLVRLLNWYSVYSNENQKKEWSIEWVKVHAPHLLPGVLDTDPVMFFTYGCLARIHLQGFPVSQEYQKKMVERFTQFNQ